MKRYGLYFLDGLCHFVHSGLIVFVMLGWLFPITRLIHLSILVVILFSWLILGRYYGFGYCILTDYHWRIKRQLGHGPLPKAYLKYVLDRILHKNLDENRVDYLAHGGLALILALTLMVNFL